MSRRILAIESATDWLSVALLEGERILEMRRSDARMQHASVLLPAIDACLRAADMDLDGIEGLAIATGPGSFTSLRIGLATVKGLAFRREIEVVGVSTLEAMALAGLEGEAGSEEGDPEVVAILDARREEWYAGSWRPGASPSGVPMPGLAEGLYGSERLATALAAGVASKSAVRIRAPEDGSWRAAFEAAGIPMSDLVLGDAARPSAEWVGRLGQRRLALGEGLSASQLTARYLRRAEAEARRLGGPVEIGEVADLESPRESG